MGTIQIKKIEKTVTTGKIGQERQKVKKTYGKIIYRGTLSLGDMAEHIMKHGTVYTEDVVIGVITKAQENVTRVGVSFLADQSKKSQYKASAMKNATTLSTQLYSEMMGEEPASNPSQGGGTSGPDITSPDDGE